MMHKKISSVDALLEYLEENIDLEHVERLEKLHLDTIMYKEVPFLPISIICPLDEYIKPFPYGETFDDPEKMLFNELLWSFSSIYNSVRLKDHHPLHIRADYGVGILPSLFGAKPIVIHDNMPWVEPVEGLEEIKKIISKGIPEFTNGLGGRVIKTYQYFNDKLKEYPKCYKAIRITQPDLQGPFDIAHLLMGTDIFYGVYDYPKIIHELLELITETYIGFRKHINSLLTHETGHNAVYVHGCIYGGKVIIKDDTAINNLSNSMYNEFSKQYNERILKAFNGGAIHYCGPYKEWHLNSLNNRWLEGINYGNPELHQLDISYKYWSERKVPILWWGYNQGVDFLKETYKHNIKTGISLAVKVKDFTQAKEILQNHIEQEHRRRELEELECQ